jgi:hypothetical protein
VSTFDTPFEIEHGGKKYKCRKLISDAKGGRFRQAVIVEGRGSKDDHEMYDHINKYADYNARTLARDIIELHLALEQARRLAKRRKKS